MTLGLKILSILFISYTSYAANLVHIGKVQDYIIVANGDEKLIYEFTQSAQKQIVFNWFDKNISIFNNYNKDANIQFNKYEKRILIDFEYTRDGEYLLINDRQIFRFGVDTLLFEVRTDHPFTFFHELAHGIFNEDVDEYFSEPLADFYAIALMLRLKKNPNFFEDNKLESKYLCTSNAAHRDFTHVSTLQDYFTKINRRDFYSENSLSSHDLSCVFNSQIFNTVYSNKVNVYKELFYKLYEMKLSKSLKNLSLDFHNTLLSHLNLEATVKDEIHQMDDSEKISYKVTEIKSDEGRDFIINAKNLNYQFDISNNPIIIEVKNKNENISIKISPSINENFAFENEVHTRFNDENPPEMKMCPKDILEVRSYFYSKKLNKVLKSKWTVLEISFEDYGQCLNYGYNDYSYISRYE